LNNGIIKIFINKNGESSEMLRDCLSQDNLLGQLPDEVQGQVKDILALILDNLLDTALTLKAQLANSHTDSNSSR
jgi:hypothetical protein